MLKRYSRKETLPGNYVYVAFYGNQLAYVGKGKGARVKHCTSGISNSYYLNQLHFDGKQVDAYLVHEGLDDFCATALEAYLICYYKPPGNANLKSVPPETYMGDLCLRGIDFKKCRELIDYAITIR